MKVNIVMKSGNVYFANLEKAKSIEDVYAHLHLHHDVLMILNDETIINTSEVAEVRVINCNSKKVKEDNQQKSNITLNVNTPVDVEKVANELLEKIKASSQRL